jgi:hypothetical protein
MGSIINYITLFKYNELIKKAKYFHNENILDVKRGKDTKILILHKCPNIILSDKVIFIKETHFFSDMILLFKKIKNSY